MASSLNKILLIGHLGKDPEVRSTQNGTEVCNFSMATSERWKDKQSGEWTEKTEWHRVVVWGSKAGPCGQYLSKGSQVYVEGKIETRKWTDRDGQERWSTEIVAQRVLFLSRSGDGGGGGGHGQPSGSSSGGGDDSGLPF